VKCKINRYHSQNLKKENAHTASKITLYYKKL
jgi:hypothetical protein